MSDKPLSSSKGKRTLADQVGAKAARKLEARRNPSQVWSGIGMMGIIGWSVVIPALLGAWIGVWLDARHTGPLSWTLALLLAGLALGCLNAWYWVAKEEKAMREKKGDGDE